MATVRANGAWLSGHRVHHSQRKGFSRDWIERQIAHAERDEIRAAYNAAEWLPQRRKMMTWRANFLERPGEGRGEPAPAPAVLIRQD